MRYKILASGSRGNALLIEDEILIDVGVPFKLLRECWKSLQVVFLTHSHKDHFNEATIRRLAQERPTLRFACGEWLVQQLLDLDVELNRIDVLDLDVLYSFGTFEAEMFQLHHDVPNCGYKLRLGTGEQVLYATDTRFIDVEAKDFDYYFIEANYFEDELRERIREKKADKSQYCYEFRVMKTHLSYEQAVEWLFQNMGEKSNIELMHRHEEKL